MRKGSIFGLVKKKGMGPKKKILSVHRFADKKKTKKNISDIFGRVKKVMGQKKRRFFQFTVLLTKKEEHF